MATDDVFRFPITGDVDARFLVQLEEIGKSFSSVDRALLETSTRAKETAPVWEAFWSKLGGKTAVEARTAILEMLRSLEGAAPTTAAELRRLAKDAGDASDASGGLAKAAKRTSREIDDAGESAKKSGVSWAELASKWNLAKEAVRTLVGGIRQLGDAATDAERSAAALAHFGSAMDEIAEATGDTLDEMDAYRAHNDLLRSGLRVTGSEFATIARYAREHREVTETTAEATQRLSNALERGARRGLREFGIAVETGATRAATFESALRQMRTTQEGVEVSSRTMGEEMKRFGDSLADLGPAAAGVIGHMTGLQGIVSSLATSFNSLVDDMREFVRIEQQLPGQQAQQAARSGAQQEYIAALREAGPWLDSMGIDRRQLPRANANQLTPEQLREVTGRLRALTGAAARGNVFSGTTETFSPGADANTLIGGESAAAVRARRNVLAGSGLVNLGAIQAGIEAARRGQNGLREDFLRTMRDINAEMERSITANTRPPPTGGPRDTAAGGGGTSDRIPSWGEQERAKMAREEGLIVTAENAIAQRQATRDASRREQERTAFETWFQDQMRASQAQATARKAHEAEIHNAAQAEERRHRFGFQMREQFKNLPTVAETAASAVRSAYDSMTSAFGDHINAVIAGKETIGEALQGMVSDTMLSISKTAGVKAAMSFAEAIFAAASYRYAEAIEFTAAGAAYLGVAALAGTVGAAIAPSATKTSTTRESPGGAADRAAAPVSPQSQTGAGGGQVINISFGTVIGGGGVRQAAREIADVLNRGAIQGGAVLNQRVVQG